ncbi:ABC transporter ATP-binding protein [Leptospira ryugenii]|uniref:ABC transporter ATP-binding protein n=1 Tax=Leptospira ryugenii TaxID=1917863 RepID=A0A2P2E2H4_9LEPT|nr:ABC transporter ATP-binding protein [Leptospira ryugenii]GBF51044.1 ABC transporter ATP-binding protein [Leptospira ryugenii]
MLKVKNLSVSYQNSNLFSFQSTELKAVESVSFEIPARHILGLVGESGCGKSTIGRAILQLQKIKSGEILYQEQDLSSLNKKEKLAIRKKIQVVFQDPYSSLNPRLTIEEIITEGLNVHHRSMSASEKKERAAYALQKVNLPAEILSRYPHEFSGGQRQRIAIARALILGPELVVCDEAVSALDISTQAQVINNLLDLRDELGISILFISHDLNIVKHISDNIAVMYLGKIVEMGSKQQISENPAHPYTKALFSASFDIKQRTKFPKALVGEIPSLTQKPSGCYFQTRCPNVQNQCKTIAPEEKKLSDGRMVSCHFPIHRSE